MIKGTDKKMLLRARYVGMILKPGSAVHLLKANNPETRAGGRRAGLFKSSLRRWQTHVAKAILEIGQGQELLQGGRKKKK